MPAIFGSFDCHTPPTLAGSDSVCYTRWHRCHQVTAAALVCTLWTANGTSGPVPPAFSTSLLHTKRLPSHTFYLPPINHTLTWLLHLSIECLGIKIQTLNLSRSLSCELNPCCFIILINKIVIPVFPCPGVNWPLCTCFSLFLLLIVRHWDGYWLVTVHNPGNFRMLPH